jgi:hypothetical protein
VLDYRPRQISLSCKSGVYKKISSKLSGFSDGDHQEGSRPLLLSSLPTNDVLLEWYKSVENYSQRDLIFENDKLPAPSGYALMMQKHVGGAYLAGLWERDLLTGYSGVRLQPIIT